MSQEVWTVIAVQRHDDGGATLTLRSANGVIKTENYPPGAKVTRIKKPAGGAA
ncbi:hypothetical protein [Mycobacterium paragordonae]|uniref:hypothetical protein n=1 Tax=Mycobacterium paragordonae TaxID=1389713 RepID=UPI0014099DF1|nr:hypothetical protein [Mycobacterium paragordonae]